MNTYELVYEYIRKRRELIAAIAQAKWKSCREGHVQRISREIAKIEEALEASDIDAAILRSMILGQLDAPACFAPPAPPTSSARTRRWER